MRAANWLAAGGEEWAAVLDTLNSGTYNNQYMVVNFKKFKKHRVRAQGCRAGGGAPSAPLLLAASFHVRTLPERESALAVMTSSPPARKQPQRADGSSAHGPPPCRRASK